MSGSNQASSLVILDHSRRTSRTALNKTQDDISLAKPSFLHTHSSRALQKVRRSSTSNVVEDPDDVVDDDDTEREKSLRQSKLEVDQRRIALMTRPQGVSYTLRAVPLPRH